MLDTVAPGRRRFAFSSRRGRRESRQIAFARALSGPGEAGVGLVDGACRRRRTRRAVDTLYYSTPARLVLWLPR
jgi:hypothetical protein